jgi:hypothetical protein
MLEIIESEEVISYLLLQKHLEEIHSLFEEGTGLRQAIGYAIDAGIIHYILKKEPGILTEIETRGSIKMRKDFLNMSRRIFNSLEKDIQWKSIELLIKISHKNSGLYGPHPTNKDSRTPKNYLFDCMWGLLSDEEAEVVCAWIRLISVSKWASSSPSENNILTFLQQASEESSEVHRNLFSRKGLLAKLDAQKYDSEKIKKDLNLLSEVYDFRPKPIKTPAPAVLTPKKGEKLKPESALEVLQERLQYLETRLIQAIDEEKSIFEDVLKEKTEVEWRIKCIVDAQVNNPQVIEVKKLLEKAIQDKKEVSIIMNLKDLLEKAKKGENIENELSFHTKSKSNLHFSKPACTALDLTQNGSEEIETTRPREKNNPNSSARIPNMASNQKYRRVL